MEPTLRRKGAPVPCPVVVPGSAWRRNATSNSAPKLGPYVRTPCGRPSVDHRRVISEGVERGLRSTASKTPHSYLRNLSVNHIQAAAPASLKCRSFDKLGLTGEPHSAPSRGRGADRRFNRRHSIFDRLPRAKVNGHFPAVVLTQPTTHCE